MDGKSPTLTTCGGGHRQVKILQNGKARKLTVTECKRLQTVPESYVYPVSDTQAYKMLGNGWTVDVIAHILHYAPGITEEPLEVLSMYDGMSCGRLALDKLGAHVARYYATEIDKYAIKTTQHNFPDTIQLGDAYQVRGDGWCIAKGGLMTNEEAIRILEQRAGHSYPEFIDAVNVAYHALRAQQATAQLDRSRWKGCICCTQQNQVRARKKHGYRYCEHCGRPLTEEAWAEMEERLGGTAL